MFIEEKTHLSEEYLNHSVFSDIQDIREFYDRLSFSCFSFVPVGTGSILNYASYIFLAIEGTLESIQLLLKKGRISDAYTLVRKYFDEVLLDIYLDVVRKDKFDWEENTIVEDVEMWLKGKIRIPQTKRLLLILKESDSSKELFPFFEWDSNLRLIREQLDDNVHGNGYDTIILNCNMVYNKTRSTHLTNIQKNISQLFELHIAFIFILNPHFLMASDYFDNIEIGVKPPLGSENWISPFAQEVFDKHIKPNADLSDFIKKKSNLNIK